MEGEDGTGGPPTVADLAEAMPPRYRAVVLVGAACGPRIGELLGLTLEALDPDAGLVRVERQLVELSGRPVAFGPLKTKASARELPVPEPLIDIILGHVATYGEGPQGAVFTTHAGGLLGRSGSGRSSTTQCRWQGCRRGPCRMTCATASPRRCCTPAAR